MRVEKWRSCRKLTRKMPQPDQGRFEVAFQHRVRVSGLQQPEEEEEEEEEDAGPNLISLMQAKVVIFEHPIAATIGGHVNFDNSDDLSGSDR